MHCPGGNATDPIWWVLASSDGISSWTPLKSRHSNPNPNPLTNQLWCIVFLTPPIPLIPHSIPPFLESFMPLKNWFMQDGQKEVSSIPYVSVAFFPSLKHNFIAYRSSKVSTRPDCTFEIHQLWQLGFSRMYSNCCCSCSLDSKIIKISQLSHKMYSNKILNFQEFATILNYCTKKSGNLLNSPRIYIYIYFFKKNKNRSHLDYKFISILLWVLISINNTKNNRTSSDLKDEVITFRVYTGRKVGKG